MCSAYKQTIYNTDIDNTLASSATFPYWLNHLPPGKFLRSDPVFKDAFTNVAGDKLLAYLKDVGLYSRI